MRLARNPARVARSGHQGRPETRRGRAQRPALGRCGCQGRPPTQRGWLRQPGTGSGASGAQRRPPHATAAPHTHCTFASNQEGQSCDAWQAACVCTSTSPLAWSVRPLGKARFHDNPQHSLYLGQGLRSEGQVAAGSTCSAALADAAAGRPRASAQRRAPSPASIIGRTRPAGMLSRLSAARRAATPTGLRRPAQRRCP